MLCGSHFSNFFQTSPPTKRKLRLSEAAAHFRQCRFRKFFNPPQYPNDKPILLELFHNFELLFYNFNLSQKPTSAQFFLDVSTGAECASVIVVSAKFYACQTALNNKPTLSELFLTLFKLFHNFEFRITLFKNTPQIFFFRNSNKIFKCFDKIKKCHRGKTKST